MLLNGDLRCDTKLLISTADPGMEDSRTYEYIAETSRRFASAGFEHRIIKTDLFGDFLDAVRNGSTRFDTPPFWTKNAKTGKRGRLLQKCTSAYKIAPMRRLIRETLQRDFGINTKSRPPCGSVRSWIGFSADEITRIKESDVKYIYNGYPLVAMRMKKTDVVAYYRKIGKHLPPRSVCVACFANDIEHFRDMHNSRPDDWAKAVAVDEACRDLRGVGIRDQCFVSSTLVPLKNLAAGGFRGDSGAQLDENCQSGYCFI